MTSRQRRFDQAYGEDVQLADGTVVRLRLIRPDDKRLLVEGFRELSPESRYRRFFGAKQELSEQDLVYLTEVDGEDHFALGATVTRDDGSEKGVGAARFIRDPVDRTCAEAAVAVIDAYQSRGLGKLLLRRLAAAARERGISHFRCTVLTDNPPMRAMLRESAARVIEELPDNGVVQVDFALPEESELQEAWQGQAARTLEETLSAVARGVARVVARR